MGMNNFNLLREDEQVSINTINALIREYFARHRGKVTYAFLTSYDGMDITVLEDLLLLLPGGNELVYKGKFDVCCGIKKKLEEVEKSYLSEMLLAHVHRICVENAFHPKIYLFYYLPEGEIEKRIFLIISSKNITRNKYLDAYACFEGIRTDEDVRNGKQLKQILTADAFWGGKESAEEIGKSLEDLEQYHFSGFDEKVEVSFHKPDRELLKDIITQEESAPKTIVVSPFVTDEIWKKSSVCLYTNEETAKELTRKTTGSLYYLNSLFLKDELKLHAKIYIKHRIRTGRTEVWIGSANFTASAFSNRNSEILACLSYEDAQRNLYRDLEQSFRQKVEEISIWKEMEDSEATEESVSDAGAERVVIPAEVYRELDKQLVIRPEKENTASCWKHSYEEIKIKDVSIKEISPQSSFPTRNGSIVFEYSKDDKTLEGSFTFDVLSKIKDETLLGEYKKAWEEYMRSECQRRNDRLLTHRKLSGIRKQSSDDSQDTQKKKRTHMSRRATLFDVVLQKKMYLTKEEIRRFLAEYQSNYIGELGQDKQLIEILMEE